MCSTIEGSWLNESKLAWASAELELDQPLATGISPGVIMNIYTLQVLDTYQLMAASFPSIHERRHFGLLNESRWCGDL